jgi:UDP-N-acetylmuramoylalanine--D-glutamate ligase
VAKDDFWGRGFLAESKARGLLVSSGPLPDGVSGGWLDGLEGPGFARLCEGGPAISSAAISNAAISNAAISSTAASGQIAELVPAAPLVPGHCQKQNLLCAGLALFALGLSSTAIREGLGSFPGVEHRLELFHKASGVEFYNDSAATIPEAAQAAAEALGDCRRLVLVTGGTDKNLDFSPLAEAIKKANGATSVVLLEGTGSDKLRILLDKSGIAYLGPFDELDSAVMAAVGMAGPGDRVALSPGCASFGMFLNEFDRGKKWKEAVMRLAYN